MVGLLTKMPMFYSHSPGEVSISDSEVDGTDYLLSSTMRLDENIFHVFGKFEKYRFAWYVSI